MSARVRLTGMMTTECPFCQCAELDTYTHMDLTVLFCTDCNSDIEEI